jgi:hypothetical protein
VIAPGKRNAGPMVYSMMVTRPMCYGQATSNDRVSMGKLISFYFTTGDSDFMLITEGETESTIAALLATAAKGMVSDVTTVRAWTAAEFKAVADKAAKLADAYRPPGK